MSYGKLILPVIIAAAIGAFFAFDLGQYLSLAYVQSQRETFQAVYAAHPVATLAAFFAIYVVVTALSLPGAAVMTLVAGALFGLVTGTVLVSFASSIGATLAFLVARLLLRDTVQRRFGQSLRKVNRGVEKDGAFYLFGLRLVPAFPFFVINLVMGLTPMRTWTFYWVSQVGMLAGTVVYVNAGTQLGQISSVGGLLSPGLIASFTALGLFPIVARKILQTLQARKALRGWEKPDSFDRDMVVIGAGSGGLVSAYIGAAVKARVSLIEKDRMGGDCLNTGCVPSKALLRSARFVAQLGRSGEYGIRSASAEFDFAEVMERVQKVVRQVELHDSVERYEGLGVDVIKGEARITSPWTVEVDGRTLTTRNIIVATGARPFVPPIPGLEEAGYLTSENLWDLRERPERLVVIGGGPIGSELTQAFARLGSHVTQVELAPRLLPREDPEAAALVAQRFAEEGIDVRTGTQAKAVETGADGSRALLVERDGVEERIPFDQILVAVGRKPNITGFGLETLGIPTTERGTIEVNEYLQTRYPNIFAVGDVVGPYQFTHAAAHQAWHAAVNALFGGFKRFAVDYSALPWSTFTDPEVARVGLNEDEAKAQGIEYEVTVYELAELDRAIAEGATEGFVKVLTVPGKDRVLGATIVGEHAGELISEYVTAIRHGLGMNKLLSTIHAYPTLMEANKFAAGEWKKAHAPQRVLAWLARYHAWRRGRPAGENAQAAQQR
ncbi:FAD-dependent oxidoreductase [Spiribacter halobius]|uniref:Pyridine nucleotide-disulfide oxidoreductase n=1 Tax=Sediminicurvatus halobius TaxID=2182432 RepID=A0A2U2N8U6_9GAMM|nr:FAD-dependent oxidoreductase [Spiribacter halobius]PWG65374.1 pyridine nucleotide-disulfide oxidoreductase [Spiribacter halobius]UEX76390.1 FAD-dependent oxidoreductase [Spiribacter halobius]